jgi:hypothetical protein
MNVTRIACCYAVATLLGLGVPLGLNSAMGMQRGPTAVGEEMEVLTRGPVHEAFAGTVTFDPEPGLIVQEAPPPAIEELPPDQRPEGTNVAWIPGYWAWDDDRTDFLWVSGIWRALPPGRQWVPGYWGSARQGAQWTSGYWADAQMTEVEYLPEPPASVESGPSAQAPSADHDWLPGSWVWQENRYVWRPGFWAARHDNWDWVPAHYVWSPRGYVFVDGYYDYSVDRRGVLFAPVYFGSRVYAQRGFTYSPSVAIRSSVFANHLFLRPNYGHYYFGDFYDPRYSNQGMSPWFSFQSSRFGYDPFYARQRWSNRQNREWEQTVQREFENRRDHENARPPRTWADYQARRVDTEARNEQHVGVAESLEELARSEGRPRRIQPLARVERQQFLERRQGIRQLLEQRQKLEVQEADPTLTPSSREFRRTRLRLPSSPIVSPPADQLDEDYAPPSRYEAPPPDDKVEPKPRQRRDAGDAPRERRPARPESVKPEPRPEPAKPEPVKPEPQPEPAKPEPVKPEPQPEPAKPEPVKPEPRPEPAKPEPVKPEPQPEPAEPETAKYKP